ncbi:hypothetical protein CN975_28365 [Bacillus cereus]|uniref:hypothetical protein n=1 Tax=Bacillus cereus TaxID=1396 RepID=UPI000BF86851|nr:hypothetical protein [Bacillus cereus]PEX04945.1 hypothetical protein CN453_05455 [Bacillus cereus]PFL29273.1 hypothetical protein COJ16_28020 [Bacillus cereus]PGN84722.1 hypothetical protein CN975_28365 [Bacillus cereus]
MQNNRKRNVIKERIRQEKERRERLLAEEEEQYEDVYKDPINEQIQQEHSEQPRNQREESVNVNLPKNEPSNSNPALAWITTIQKQAGTSENDLKIEEAREREEEARRKAEEEARKQAGAEARRKAEEEARKRAEAETRRRAEEEARKEAEARRKEEEKKLEEVRKRRLEEEKKIKEAQKRQKIAVVKREPYSDEINLNNERNLPNEPKFEQEEKVAIDKKGILNNMKKLKYAIIGIASIVLLVVAGFAFSNMKNSQAASANNVNSLEVNANLINGLRLSAVQKYQDAALEFDKVDYKKLGKEDKKAVLFTYLLSGKAQKAIDLEQDFAESVVSYYIAVDNLKKVKELKTKNPLINFEIAALDNKHEEVINLRDQVPLDGRREGIIVNSYLKLNKSEEAKKFAQKVGNKDLLEKINNSTPNSSATSVATISAD